MIRQARSYFVGAVSGTALVAVAVVVFMVLVSTQALRDWPIGSLGLGGDETSSESPAPQVSGAGAGSAVDAAAVGAVPAADGGGVKSAGPEGTSAQSPGIAASTPQGAPAPSAGSPGSSAPGSNPTPSNQGGSTSGGSGSAGKGAPASVTGSVTDTVNDAVAGVDQALGGPLEESGVTKATEGAVNGLAGPESVAGQTVDGLVDSVEGLLDEDQ